MEHSTNKMLSWGGYLSLLLFLHSLTGGDSTSRLFGSNKKIRINCILISYVILIELFTKDIYKRLLVMTV
jgi:hypothetical protein